ncbi:MAG: GreA/GreB family elongation factor [Armatimonadetes bacterium]|nr:GreA/GreB family elongation factor [Armatimonadota bacterium]MDW8121846.1 GreA/GreB family elongation factor [Armatimonadota bacterium]
MAKRMTKQAVQAIEQEIRELTEKRLHLIEAVREAASEGDLSENAGLDTAKRLLALTEARLKFLKEQLLDVEVVEWEGQVDTVDVGVILTLEDLSNGTILKVRIADSLEGPSSDGVLTATPDSPVGKALLGKKVGDEVRIQNRQGIRHWKIVALSTTASAEQMATDRETNERATPDDPLPDTSRLI